MADGVSEGVFAPGLAALAMTHACGCLRGREGLDRHSRSLVTLGLLIALRADEEPKINFLMALRNRRTRAELEEVIYHATGYAGFPAAVHAVRVGTEVLDADRTTGSTTPAGSPGPDASHTASTAPQPLNARNRATP